MSESMIEPIFTTNWAGSISYWPEMFQTLGLTGKPDLRFLEIGCFEGRTTLWLLQNVLTNTSSTIDVIDTFEGSPEFELLGIDRDFRGRFENNIAEYRKQIRVFPGRSDEFLPEFRAGKYDFIYVDGSHHAADVLSDAVLSWPLLKEGGVMCFDDYRWGEGLPRWERPQIAIESFVQCYAPHLSGSPQGEDHYVVIKK